MIYSCPCGCEAMVFGHRTKGIPIDEDRIRALLSSIAIAAGLELAHALGSGWYFHDRRVGWMPLPEPWTSGEGKTAPIGTTP